MAKPTVREIAFDSAVFACAAYVVRSEGSRVEVTVKEMLRDFDPKIAHGNEGDLECLRDHGIIN